MKAEVTPSLTMLQSGYLPFLFTGVSESLSLLPPWYLTHNSPFLQLPPGACLFCLFIQFSRCLHVKLGSPWAYNLHPPAII